MNILKLADLEVKEIEEILDNAAAFKHGNKKINYNGEKIIANLFLNHQQEHIIVLKQQN